MCGSDSQGFGYEGEHVSGLHSVRGVGCGVREKVMALEICDGQEEETWTGDAGQEYGEG